MTYTQLAVAIPAALFLVYRLEIGWWRRSLVRSIERDPETRARRALEATR